MNKPAYKNLLVYQKAKNQTINIIKYFTHKKTPFAYTFIVDQLLRAASSIGANIAEGYGTHYQKSFRHYLSIARGSSFETEYWLDVVIELKIFDNGVISGFLKENNEIIKMLTVMMKNLEKKTQS
jgi:four helix bundle protein